MKMQPPTRKEKNVMDDDPGSRSRQISLNTPLNDRWAFRRLRIGLMLRF